MVESHHKSEACRGSRYPVITSLTADTLLPGHMYVQSEALYLKEDAETPEKFQKRTKMIKETEKQNPWGKVKGPGVV